MKSYFKKFALDENLNVFIGPKSVDAVEETPSGTKIHCNGVSWLVTDDDVIGTLRRILTDNVPSPEPTPHPRRNNE